MPRLHSPALEGGAAMPSTIATRRGGTLEPADGSEGPTPAVCRLNDHRSRGMRSSQKSTALDHRVTLHCIGGFAIAMLYGLPRPTMDVDCLSVILVEDIAP